MTENYFLKKRDIRYHLSDASVEEVSEILDNYKATDIIDGISVNMQPVIVNGITTTGKYDPLEAASFNARYYQLTGCNHPVFLKEQAKAIDTILKNKRKLSSNGNLSFNFDILEKLRNNLFQEIPAIDVIGGIKHNILNRKSDILLNLEQASLEDVNNVLNHYKASNKIDCGTINMPPIIVDGIVMQYKYNPQEAASFNSRYRELTGHDHPVFLQEQAKAIDILLKNKKELERNRTVTSIDILKRLRDNLKQSNSSIEISNKTHIINKTDQILLEPEKASLEEINSLLNYYNGKPVIINGISHTPFNDPMSAKKLNDRYYELTGNDHPVYLEQTPKVIDDMLNKKSFFLKNGIFSENYFNSLLEIKNNITSNLKDIRRK